jgi:lipopolysaccharide/colanic/teichoic acid biosynthesis glycosyltransferase
MIKRIFDITFSFAGFCVLLPLFLIIFVLILIFEGGSPFFVQERVGYKKKIFKLIKFRTMRNFRNKEGALLPDGDRLTGLGRFLRRTSLDEIPQLLNVLKGDMSLVGPRPLLVQYLPLYNSFQMRRHEVRPGITGWAQVNGRNAISWEQKFEYDVWYVDHGSLGLDFKIIFQTLKKVVAGEGISQQDHATMEYFKGTK